MDSYDYVIVGGGTAGPVLAARLSENPAARVLMLEAGGENTKEAMHFVNGAGQMWGGDTNWGYNTVPQTGLTDREIMQPRGKVVGGSASINVGSWSRGTAANYDGWNLPEWTWDEVKPWYLAMEDSDRGANEHRGVGGPMKLETAPKGTYMTALFEQACIESGVGATDDLNAASAEGFDRWQTIFRNGRRHNTVSNYLDGVRQRANLTITTNAMVHKVIIETGVATGVLFTVDGVEHRASAAAEIVLCAGAFGSPQILMLSGIGPADHLQDIGIDVVLDLPGVGTTLRDHLRTDVGVMSPDGVGMELRADASDAGQLKEWRTTGYGPLATPENTSVAFTKSSDEVPAPDIEIMFNINAPGPMGEPPPTNGYHLDVALVQPKSFGTVRLASSDPADLVLVDPNYFTDPADVAAYTKGIRKALEVMHTETLAPFTDYSTFTLSADASDDDIRQYIAERAESVFHPGGSNRMGLDDDADAVVNQRCQVRGIDRLRVADTSVLPELISGHTMAPTILVAERTAHDIINGTTKKEDLS